MKLHCFKYWNSENEKKNYNNITNCTQKVLKNCQITKNLQKFAFFTFKDWEFWSIIKSALIYTQIIQKKNNNMCHMRFIYVKNKKKNKPQYYKKVLNFF